MGELERFVTAQESSYDDALAELRRGQKRSHWMWFVFPQLAGLGRSETARFYALADLAEARVYLSHPVLGDRLRECCRALLALEQSDPQAILGGIDAVKLRSSMTLFATAAPDEPLFPAVLEKLFAGQPDELTLGLL